MASHNGQSNTGLAKTMSVILPKRANVDYLAPSQALEDAKKKLGPLYFDAKLIECPQNAVELSKLMQEWDEIDKKKFHVIEETRRSQRVLLHTLGSRYSFSNHASSLASCSDLRDVKLPPPGFRYHSNGKPKLSLVPDQDLSSEYSPSTSCIGSRVESNETVVGRPLSPPRPHLHHNDLYDDSPEIANETFIDHENVSAGSSEASLTINEKFVPGESRITIAKVETQEPSLRIDYENEIKNLENIIKEINEDLEKNHIDLYENSGSAKGKVYAFLRAHARGDKVTLKQLIEPNESAKPNDRFAIAPGSSAFDVRCKFDNSHKSKSNLHKTPANTSNHGNCVACVCKLKHQSAVWSPTKRDVSKTVLQRWNSSTHGQIHESTTALPTVGACDLGNRACSAFALGRKSSISLPKSNTASVNRFAHTTAPQKSANDEEGVLQKCKQNKKSSMVMFNNEIMTTTEDTPTIFRTTKSTPDSSILHRESSHTVHLRNSKSAQHGRSVSTMDSTRAKSDLFVRPSSCSRDQQSRMDFLKADAVSSKY